MQFAFTKEIGSLLRGKTGILQQLMSQSEEEVAKMISDQYLRQIAKKVALEGQ